MICFSPNKDNNASLTVAVLDVLLKEASRFSIMNTDATTVSLNSKKNLRNLSLQRASMGIYILTGKRLRNMLVAAEKYNVICRLW